MPVFQESDDDEKPDATETPPVGEKQSVLRSGMDVSGWVDSKDAMADVIDVTAKIVDGKPPEQCRRIHSISVGGVHRNYTFLPDTALKMPLADALQFLRHDFFQVSVDGQRLKRPLDIQDLAKTIDPKTLPPDQCVAEYSELTADALLIRCKMQPGGSNLSARSGREALVKFLVGLRRQSMKATADVFISKRDPDLEEMGADELAEMMPMEDA